MAEKLTQLVALPNPDSTFFHDLDAVISICSPGTAAVGRAFRANLDQERCQPSFLAPSGR